MAYPKPKDKAKRPKYNVPFKKEQVALLISKYGGNLSKVADALGTTRTPMRRFIDSHPDLQQALADARERLIEEVEDSVFARAATGQDTALQAFLLKTQGRHKGWDQSEAQHAARDVAQAAFDFILNKSKNPAE